MAGHMTHAEHALVCVVVGHEPPVTAVVYFDDTEADMPTDSGFTLLLADAPDADDLADDIANDPRVSTVCLHCAIDNWPEAGRGFDLARRCGEANRDDNGDWR